MANRDIESLKAQVDRRGLGYRQPSDHVKSADDLRTDSLRGRAMREGGKGSWNRVENLAEYRRRMDLFSLTCPKCSANVMRRKSGATKCWRCGTKITNGGRK